MRQTLAAYIALFVSMLQRDMARSSVVRVRAVVGGFYSWAMRQKVVAVNPIKDAPVPKGTGVKKADEVHPFTIDELREVVASLDGNQADVALFLGLSGLRWGEMVALRVRDVVQVPHAAVRVSKSARQAGRAFRHKGQRGTHSTADRRTGAGSQGVGRRKKPSDYLFTSAQGHKLNGPNWRRSTGWSKHNRGRRIHDLRHTAATF